MSTIARRDIIVALRDQRRALVNQLEAVENALRGFGEEVPQGVQRTRRRHASTLERDNAILEWFQANQGWHTSKAMCEATDLPRGSAAGVLSRLVADGQLLEDKSAEPWTWAAP